MTDLDDVLGLARENWRVILLTVLLLASAFAVFSPSAAREGPTNLEYGLQLDGGTRVRAPLVGMTAEQVDMEGMNNTEIAAMEQEVAAELDLVASDVEARPREATVEVYAEVSEAEFRAALDGYGVEYDRIRDGVTRQTREEVRDVLQDKLRRSPQITGERVTLTQTPGGEHYIQVEVPGATRQEVLEVIEQPGRVQVYAVFPRAASGGDGGAATPTPTPGPNATATPSPTTTPTATPTADGNGSAEIGRFEGPEGYSAVPLLGKEDMAGISSAQESRTGQPVVPLTLTDEAGQNFSQAMRRFGFTGEGVGRCSWQVNRGDPGWCLVVVRDGQSVSAFSMGADLARIIDNGQFVKSDQFQLTTTNMSDAREVQIDLQAGALPTRLDIDEGSIFFTQPSLGGDFKIYSLITGILAALMVSLAVFGRYRNARVALPMWLTALSEVFILLGFAAALPLRLDLAHIAGFIAVIGTGVDDLVIIADEVMSQGDVRTRRVFQSRFRKAFWVIGAAAATTIIAMSPLFALGLGDLSGFAGVTIIGVLIGVLITRPAYGDILRSLVTTDED